MKNHYLNPYDYPFETSDFLHYFKNLYKDRGLKALYQVFNRPHRRSYTRYLIAKFAPSGIGLEIGVGARTVAPTNRTILADAYDEHGVHHTIAKLFFRGEDIPYRDETFDFLLTEHVLEHITNPLKALKEWIRVLKVGGVIILILPHKERNNDVNRESTSLDHLIEDEKNKTPFNDEAHFQEWWDLVVLKNLMPEHYKHMEKKELLDSCSIHHHVWTDKEMAEVFKYLKLKLVHTESKLSDRRDSFMLIGEKRAL